MNSRKMYTFQRKACGLGCQIHHRVACIMLSYILNIPLIHDEETGWSYSKRWSEVFEPLGSTCVPNPKNTINWRWQNSKEYRNLNPLTKGLPVDGRIADLVEKYVDNPFVWWVGQFLHYTLKLNQKYKARVEEDKLSIGFKHPIAGFHIRRTDKVKEAGKSILHETSEYMTAAEKYFNRTTKDHKDHSDSIFIASEDISVLPNAQERYQNWTIIGLRPSNETLKSQKARKNFFYEIARDIFTLSECDHVVCGFSSNVCTLAMEMLSFRYLNSSNYLTPLDGKYRYPLSHKHSIPLKVLKIYPASA